MYSKRAQLLLESGRPYAAINDCTVAIKIHPNSGKALKIRGRAYAKVEKWTEARADLQEGLKIDYDEDTQEEFAKVQALAEEALYAQCQMWEIVGGADLGGLLVREGKELSSPQVSERLSTGALVRELDLVGERLLFRRCTGTGPDRGWISIALKEKILACRVSSSTGPDAAANTEPEVEEPAFPAMSPSNVMELSDDMLDRQSVLKQEAADAQEDGNQELALAKLTDAIAIGCASALMYSRRAQLLLQLSRPKAAINDCDAALAINPDSGKAFKIRARAHMKLKHWKQAHSDFQEGLRIDYDEGTYEESLSVAAKMKDINALSAERRVKAEVRAEEAARQRQLAEQQALQRRKEAEEQQRAKLRDIEQKGAREKQRWANQPLYQQAKKQGFMTDFMGQKRGKCTSKNCRMGGTCEFYLWRPVRLSS
eukprot:gnl/TRDRNA2_/TRDRNA2_167447_c0_seq2.p1 gnl/TRDRNA2_/TRDRNA2_167447_c0~~gnl/TRDRNA2_/TRDRNA2_167447_c0_seq2.p1  ORF type:complete len:502 (+),score=128.88 gnl/TRDRNA2_/TRDRNA2_167447_c0_seq2:227-1507(+)